MIKCVELCAYLDNVLRCADFKDYAPNGLQIEGSASISILCTAVTASLEAIKQASALKAQALLVHHGYFWRGENPTIAGMKKQRIGLLMQQDINLLAYHLPLDCHPELGNNACLGKLLGVIAIESHTVNGTPRLLWTGSFAAPKTASELSACITRSLNYKPLHLAGSNKPIQRIAWCSGAAQDLIEEAYALKVDAYISGEVSERTFYQAEELGIHYFACGHHATERYGVQALGLHLANAFQLQHYFIDSGNPV